MSLARGKKVTSYSVVNPSRIYWGWYPRPGSNSSCSGQEKYLMLVRPPSRKQFLLLGARKMPHARGFPRAGCFWRKKNARNIKNFLKYNKNAIKISKNVKHSWTIQEIIFWILEKGGIIYKITSVSAGTNKNMYETWKFPIIWKKSRKITKNQGNTWKYGKNGMSSINSRNDL